MKKPALCFRSLISLAMVAILGAGCGQTGSGSMEGDSNSLAAILLGLFGGSGSFTIKMVNARADRSTTALDNPTQYVYMQTNKTFLNGPDGRMITAGEVICMDTRYKAHRQETASETTYTFTTTQNKDLTGMRIYYSIGTALPGNSEHAPIDPDMRNIRFDWVEMTLDGTSTACANLTSLEQLGICMTLTAKKDNDAPSATLGWKNKFNDLVTASPAGARLYHETSGKIIRIQGASKYPDQWPAAQLLTGIANKPVILTGNFNGVAGAGEDNNPAAFRFTGTFNGTGTGITLSGKFYEQGGTYDATMNISGLTAEPIYAARAAGCTITHSGGNYTGDSGATGNSRWSKLFGNLVAGINTGLWAEEANNLRWTSAKAYTNASTCNPYSKMIKENSNSYGDPYSDLLEKVLLNLDQKKVNTLVITMLDDGATGGYTAPTPVTHLSGFQMAIPYSEAQQKNTIDLLSITFTQGATSKTRFPEEGGSTILFPAEIVFGTPVTLKLNYSNYTASTTVFPNITVTLPENVFEVAPNLTIPANWLVKGAERDHLFEWHDRVLTNPFRTLTCSGVAKADCFSPVAPLEGYYITYPSSWTQGATTYTLTSIDFGGGTVMRPYENRIYFPETFPMDSAHTLDLTYTLSGGGTSVCPVVITIPSASSVKPTTIGRAGWNTALPTEALFNWNGVEHDWHLDLSGNAHPGNYTP